jgi:hypothetical protein
VGTVENGLSLSEGLKKILSAEVCKAAANDDDVGDAVDLVELAVGVED